ncbi:hypothetical protein RYX36_029940 [Vicia faba]
MLRRRWSAVALGLGPEHFWSAVMPTFCGGGWICSMAGHFSVMDLSSVVDCGGQWKVF